MHLMHIQHLIKSLESLYQEILNLALIALNLFLPKFFEIVEKVNKNLKMVFKIKFYILKHKFMLEFN